MQSQDSAARFSRPPPGSTLSPKTHLCKGGEEGHDPIRYSPTHIEQQAPHLNKVWTPKRMKAMKYSLSSVTTSSVSKVPPSSHTSPHPRPHPSPSLGVSGPEGDQRGPSRPPWPQGSLEVPHVHTRSASHSTEEQEERAAESDPMRSLDCCRCTEVQSSHTDRRLHTHYSSPEVT